MLQMFKTRRFFLLLGGVSIALATGLVGILYIMPPLNNADDIVYLKGDDTPYKVRPSEEGGQKIAHQDSRFMNYLDKGETEAEEAVLVWWQDSTLTKRPVTTSTSRSAWCSFFRASSSLLSSASSCVAAECVRLHA